MRLTDLHIDNDRLAEICRRYKVVRLEVCGERARRHCATRSRIRCTVGKSQSKSILASVSVRDSLFAVFVICAL